MAAATDGRKRDARAVAPLMAKYRSRWASTYLPQLPPVALLRDRMTSHRRRPAGINAQNHSGRMKWNRLVSMSGFLVYGTLVQRAVCDEGRNRSDQHGKGGDEESETGRPEIEGDFGAHMHRVGADRL